MAPSNPRGLTNESGDEGEAAQDLSPRDDTKNKRLSPAGVEDGVEPDYRELVRRERRG